MTDRPDRLSDASEADAPTLNEHHRRHLLASCQYIDRLLTDIDNIAAATETQSPFARYAADLSPTLKRLLRDYFVRLRTDMLRILQRHDALPAGRMISAVHAIRTALGFVEISIEELKPEHIKGYGQVPPALVSEINGFVEELQSVVRAIDQALAAGAAGDVHERLVRLERAGADVGLIAALDRIVTEEGLVEFRPSLNTALSRLEDQRFEIAVFGRVSSGKSSLLNHLLDRPVLPVGVTPITAVPTRVMYGPTPEVEVHFADRRAETAGIDRLHEFVTEQDNPANVKHVGRLIVRVPASRLKDGIVFVDTPGLGSLATSGAAETLAYLPRCDLGVVLIDAASTLTEEDLRTIQRLQQGAIPAMVVLSKADLLTAADRDRALAYVASHLLSELGAQIGVHAVSTMAGHLDLLDAWILNELRPLLAQHRELARQSVQRKIGALRAGIEAALQARIRRGGALLEPARAAESAKVEQALREASGQFDEVRRVIDAVGDVSRADVDRVLRETATDVVARLRAGDARTRAQSLVSDALTRIAGEQAEGLARALTTLAENSRRILTRAAQALDLPEPSSDDEWAALLRELPPIDAGPLEMDLRRPLLGVFGRGVANARMYRVIAGAAGPQIAAAIETHARLLRSWGLRVLGRLRQQFDVQAQVYRTQLSGATSRPLADAGAARALEKLKALDDAQASR